MRSKTIESVDISTSPAPRDPGMGDPAESDAAKDAAAEGPQTLAEIEAARGARPGSSETVAGSAYARAIAAPQGALIAGARQCGNPIGYGNCLGEIDENDPEGRCSKCGIPTRLASLANAGTLHGGYDQQMGKIVEIGGSTRAIQQSALELEGTRLAITRRLTAEVFAENGWSSENGAEHATMPVALRAAWVRIQAEVDRRVTAALRACGLAPMPSRA